MAKATPYEKQKYPYELAVRVTHEHPWGTSTHLDAVKGLNAGHAAWRARNNWDAHVEPLGPLADHPEVHDEPIPTN